MTTETNIKTKRSGQTDQLFSLRKSKERVKNKLPSLTRPFVPHLHLKKPYVAWLYAVFQTQMRNKISFSKM